MNPELFALSQIDWQFFATLTFKQEKLGVGVRLKMFFAWQRTQCENAGIHFKQSLWALRSERGEQFGRIHFHALLAGFPEWFVNPRTIFSMINTWGCGCVRGRDTVRNVPCDHQNFGGGIARIYKYDASLSGASYILKGLDSEVSKIRNDKNFYEAKKFGGSCDLMLSESLVRVLQVGIHRKDRTDSTTQNGVG